MTTTIAVTYRFFMAHNDHERLEKAVDVLGDRLEKKLSEQEVREE